MTLIPATEAKIAALRAELEKEEAKIAAAVASKQIGDGNGYWKRRHELRQKLHTAVELRAALLEALA